MDGKEGGHFNLTQVPFDVEIDENGFAFDYQVAITFELCERTLLRDEIYAKTEERLKAMKIDLGPKKMLMTFFMVRDLSYSS